MNKSICKLCLFEKELCDSHVYPEFLYKPLYDKKHNYIVLFSKDKKGKRPKGIYDRLFCKECEKIIGQYENYASRVLFGNGKTELEIDRFEHGFLINQLDYQKFKLFQLSLLWRPSVSTRKEVKKINLGPHSEKIRNMILTGNPGKYYEYGCALFFLPNQPDEFKELIIQPHPLPTKVDGHRAFRAIFNGIFWIYVVSNHTDKFDLRRLFLTEEGVLPITNSGTFGWSFLAQWAKDVIDKKNIT